MASINTIVDELKLIGNAFTSIETVLYSRVSEINATMSKQFPLLLIDSVHQTTRGVVNSDYLPRKKRYQFNIYVYDVYNSDERSTKELEEKQHDVDSILDKYIAEVLRRTIEIGKGFNVVSRDNMTGFIAVDVHNQKLVQSSYRLDIEVDSDCTLGTFNY